MTNDNPVIPFDARFAATMQFFQSWFERTGAQILDMLNRIDTLRDRVGAIHEKEREAIEGLRNRVEKVEPLIVKVNHIDESITGLTPIIEQRLEHAGRIAEQVRADFGTVSARYQQSLSEIQIDFDEKFAAIDKRMSTIEEMFEKRQGEAVDLQKTRLTVRAQVVMALIGAIGGGSGLLAVVLTLAARGGP